MAIPESLARRIALFRGNGSIFREADELFTEVGWLQVLLGQGIEPQSHHPLADALDQRQLEEFLGNIRTLVGRAADTLPSHEYFIAEHCAQSGTKVGG
jgi:tryptophan halogenase